MSDLLAHRGPDAQGFMASDGVTIDSPFPGLIGFSPILSCQVALAHRRLSIVDPSPLGHQPMVWQNRYVITFNGEIYNYIELREILIALGYDFTSECDTEVILAAYDAWGTSCLNKFNGMWAFVIVDALRGRAFIARDRFGIKPLYYAQNGGNFVFASEIKALLRYPGVDAVPDVQYAQDYLKKGPSEGDKRTSWKNIERFPASGFLECGLDQLCTRTLTPVRYWNVQPNLSREPFDDVRAQQLSDAYYELLEDAVRLRLRADVQVGSALSGGLDSSSIVYLINKLLREQGAVDRQETFSSVYKSPGTKDCDESPFIDRLARALDVHSNQIEPQVDAIPDEQEKLIYAMDEAPESTCMSGWYTFKCVAQTNVKVTLDGQGADEQLAGYLSYWAFWFAQMPLRAVFAELPKVLAMPGAARFAWRGLVVGMVRRVLGKSMTRALVHRLGYPVDPFMHVNERLVHDTKTSLRVLIHYSDRVSMAHSIESRMPFMDYRLVEFLASVPVAYKLHDGWTKYLARRAFSGKLPNEIVWRKDKMGWPIPEAYWFDGKLKGWMEGRVNDPDFLRWLGVDAAQLPLRRPEVAVTRKVRWLNLATWHRVFVAKAAVAQFAPPQEAGTRP